ncbi:speckle-type POZ protein-like [Aphidius gifuensis]|uniref:speckle-type POZ protein-like n=1 Tax=Aphidius gifuensis TaxID=684658 RepID=UPI001CDC78BE|nr:speckle-type POZ protein-like [Aphidius gifuensis]
MSGLAGPSHVTAVTGMECCEFTYEWKIKNFKQSYKKTCESPSFSSHYSDFHDKWIMKIYPNDMANYCGDICIVADLQLQSFNNTSQLQTKCKILIDNKHQITKEHDFSKFPETITCSKIIPTMKLLETINEYFRNDELKICCTIRMFKKLTNSSATSQLSEDWKKLLLNKKSSDITIKVGQKSFRAIKGILGVRSPVFAAIYQVDCLKNICEEIICGSTIDFDNISSILVCSDRYNLKKLNQKCLEFMKKNLRDVMANKTFQVYKKKYSEIFVGVLEELLLS